MLLSGSVAGLTKLGVLPLARKFTGKGEMMKLQDMKIGTQLRIGMGAILVFVAILGATAWFQADSLWEET